MKCRTRHFELGRHAAKTALTCRAVNAAPARAQGALAIESGVEKLRHRGSKLKKDALLKRPLKKALRLEVCGGDEGNRTLGLCHATAALSQLSYVPLGSASLSMADHRQSCQCKRPGC